MKKKRRQHYVWKHYLEPWCTKGQLYCLRENEIFSTNPTNVANERDFYRLKRMTVNDISWIKLLIDNTEPPAARDIIMDHFKLVTRILNLETSYKALSQPNSELEKEIDQLINDFEENFFVGVEQNYLPFLNALKQKNTNFYQNDNERFSFLENLCQQYFRTKKWKIQLQF